MQKNKYIIKKILSASCKTILYLIIAITISIIFAIIFLFMLSLYEKNKFINNCINDGHSQEYCQNVWNEIDALN